MRKAATSFQLPASSRESGLGIAQPARRGWAAFDERGLGPVTGRCEPCGRLAYGRDPLCPICRAELAYKRQVEALGVKSRCTETVESRALDRWLRRKERLTALRFVRDWVLGLVLCWALVYLGWKFAALFVAWAMGISY